MTITVTVHPNSKTNHIVAQNEKYDIYTSEKTQNNQANLAVIDQLSKYFKTAKSNITIIRGHKSKLKVISIIL